jgi:hypothetical protein
MFIPVDDPQQILPTAEYVGANTQPGELVALAGQDWDPRSSTTRTRQGLMVRGNSRPDTYSHLCELGYKKLFYCPSDRGTAAPCDIVDLTAS